MVEYEPSVNLDGLREHERLSLWWESEEYKLWEGDHKIRLYPRIGSDEHIEVRFGSHNGLMSTDPRHSHRIIICGKQEAKFEIIYSDGDIIAAVLVDNNVDTEKHFQTKHSRDRR